MKSLELENFWLYNIGQEEDLLKDLDSLVRTHKFPNRSQAIRFLIRKNLVEEAWDNNKEVSFRCQ